MDRRRAELSFCRSCRALTKERERLRIENAQLQQERDDYRKAVVAMMEEPFEFDKRAAGPCRQAAADRGSFGGTRSPCELAVTDDKKVISPSALS